MSVDHFTVLQTRPSLSTIWITGSGGLSTSTTTVQVNVNGQFFPATIVQVLNRGTAALVSIPFGPIRTGDALLLLGNDSKVGQTATTGATVVPCILKGKHHKHRQHREKTK